jgi:hypothetical protein
MAKDGIFQPGLISKAHELQEQKMLIKQADDKSKDIQALQGLATRTDATPDTCQRIPRIGFQLLTVVLHV